MCRLLNINPKSKSSIINNTKIQFMHIKQLKNNHDNAIPTKICKKITNPKLNPKPYKRKRSPDNKREHKFLNIIKNKRKRNRKNKFKRI